MIAATDKPKTALVKRDERRGLPSASSMARYFACPGSYLLEKQVPEHERFTNKDAERGTRLHAANEAGTVEGLVLSEADIIERVRSTEERVFTLWKDDFNLKESQIEIIRERRWWLTKGRSQLCSGKMDFVALAAKARIALILDLKSGRKETTPAPSNQQLRTCAVILTSNYNLSHVRVGIVAPFQKTQPLCDYKLSELFEAWQKLEELLQAIKDPTAKRFAGVQCEYCPACHICPEAEQQISAVAALTGLKWALMSPEEKFSRWDLWQRVKKIGKQLDENFKPEVKRNPELFSQWVEYKPGPPNRELDNIPLIYAELEKHIEFQPEEFSAMCSLSVGALTEFVRRKTGKTAKEADEWINKTLENHISLKPKEGRLVRVKEEKK